MRSSPVQRGLHKWGQHWSFQAVREHLVLPQIGALLGPKTAADLAKPEKKKKEPKVLLAPALNAAQFSVLNEC